MDLNKIVELSLLQQNQELENSLIQATQFISQLQDPAQLQHYTNQIRTLIEQVIQNEQTFQTNQFKNYTLLMLYFQHYIEIEVDSLVIYETFFRDYDIFQLNIENRNLFDQLVNRFVGFLEQQGILEKSLPSIMNIIQTENKIDNNNLTPYDNLYLEVCIKTKFYEQGCRLVTSNYLNNRQFLWLELQQAIRYLLQCSVLMLYTNNLQMFEVFFRLYISNKQKYQFKDIGLHNSMISSFIQEQDDVHLKNTVNMIIAKYGSDIVCLEEDQDSQTLIQTLLKNSLCHYNGIYLNIPLKQILDSLNSQLDLDKQIDKDQLLKQILILNQSQKMVRVDLKNELVYFDQNYSEFDLDKMQHNYQLLISMYKFSKRQYELQIQKQLRKKNDLLKKQQKVTDIQQQQP